MRSEGSSVVRTSNLKGSNEKNIDMVNITNFKEEIETKKLIIETSKFAEENSAVEQYEEPKPKLVLRKENIAF